MGYKYFENNTCEFYPCHNLEHLNCLFCFCPLYNIDCGGDFTMIQGEDKSPIKDCTNCLIPHIESGYEYVIKVLENTQNRE